MKIKVNEHKLDGKIKECIYTCKIFDGIMDRQIIEEIDVQGDKQNHKTNVKAQMTD